VLLLERVLRARERVPRAGERALLERERAPLERERVPRVRALLERVLPLPLERRKRSALALEQLHFEKLKDGKSRLNLLDADFHSNV
jgi:hypothetical protein